MSETQKGTTNKPFVPFDSLMGKFSFATAPKFAELQEELVASLEAELLSRAETKQIDRPHIQVKARAKEPEWILVIDVRNEPLLFNVTARDIAFRLDHSSDFKLLAEYLQAFVRASNTILGQRAFVGFDVQSTQIVRFAGKRNWELMANLVSGLEEGEHLCGYLPRDQSNPPYRVQRTDVKCTILANDLEYIFDVQAPANEKWQTLWFMVTVRTPEEKMAEKEHLNSIE